MFDTKFGENLPKRSNCRTKYLYKHLFKFFKKTIILQACKLLKFGSKTTCDKASFMKKPQLINVLPHREIYKIKKREITKIQLSTLRK